jgi:hypothetical protein
MKRSIFSCGFIAENIPYECTRCNRSNPHLGSHRCYNTFVSAFNEIDVTCKNCGHEFKGVVWTAVHAAQDPQLKDMLLGGELNILFCPQCGHTFFYEHFLLYQDPRLKLVAYVHPVAEENRREELEMSMDRGFDEAQAAFELKDRLSYRPVLVFGLDQLKERIRNDEKKLLEAEVDEARRAAGEIDD